MPGLTIPTRKLPAPAGWRKPSAGLLVRPQGLAQLGGVVVAQVNLVGAAINAEPNRLSMASRNVRAGDVIDQGRDDSRSHPTVMACRGDPALGQTMAARLMSAQTAAYEP